MITERIAAVGDANVRATHASTVEVTVDDWLTPAGDCILGIEATRTPADFSTAFIEAARNDDAEITLKFEADGLVDRISGSGDSRLTFESDRCLIARTSDYVDDRTVMVQADGAARDIDRALVERLQAGAELTVELSVEATDP